MEGSSRGSSPGSSRISSPKSYSSGQTKPSDAVDYMDQLIKQCLTYRGFTNTLREYNKEIEDDVFSGFNADKVVSQMFDYVKNGDLEALLATWERFDLELLPRRGYDSSPDVLNTFQQLKSSVLKLYLVSTLQRGEKEKAIDFFKRIGEYLFERSEWKDWFSVPYVENVSVVPQFRVYFTREWANTLRLSLRNFLDLLFSQLPKPDIVDFARELRHRRELIVEATQRKEEIKLLKAQLRESKEKNAKLKASGREGRTRTPSHGTKVHTEKREEPEQEIIAKLESECRANGILNRSRFHSNGRYIASGMLSGETTINYMVGDKFGKQQMSLNSWAECRAIEWSGDVLLGVNSKGVVFRWTDIPNVFQAKLAGARPEDQQVGVVKAVCDMDFLVVKDLAASHVDQIYSVSVSSTNNTNEGRIYIRDIKGSSIRRIGNLPQSDSVSFSHDGRCLLSGSRDGKSRMFDTRDSSSETPISILNVNPEKPAVILNAKFTKSDRFVTTVDASGSMKLWDVANLTMPVNSFVLPNFGLGTTTGVDCVNITLGGEPETSSKIVAFSCGTPYISIVNCETSEILAKIDTKGAGNVVSVDFNNKKQSLLAAVGERAMLWNLSKSTK